KVDQDNANVELIRRWLTQCHRVHGIFCEESGGAARTLPHIRVIDVQSGSIIEAPHPCRYIALSYVWGNSNSAQLKRKALRFDDRGSPFARLPQKLPQTIEDAIHVTRSLGERYLWVDSLCIIQDSAPDKRTQMEHMDAIYSSAFVTIAAASGSEANAGLAGISRPRAVVQDVEVINGSEYARTFPAYMGLLSDPSITWNTRGWT
ncbi:HET-domain-containing protein, partial [Acephala macrosclerotiorum]